MLNWNTKKVGKFFLQDFVLIFFLVRNVNLKHILQLLFRALQELERCLVEAVWFAASYRK